jgi:hypothetical protein
MGERLAPRTKSQIPVRGYIRSAGRGFAQDRNWSAAVGYDLVGAALLVGSVGVAYLHEFAPSERTALGGARADRRYLTRAPISLISSSTALSMTFSRAPPSHL